MTIPANTSPISTYVGNNVAFQFPFYFRALKAADIIVSATIPAGNPVTLVQGADYSFTFKTFPLMGGGITLTNNGQAWMQGSTLKNNVILEIAFAVVPAQLFKFRDWGPLAPVMVEQSFDNVFMNMIAIQGEIERGLLIPGGGSSGSFPALAGNANKLVHVNAAADGFEYGPVVQDIYDAVADAQVAASDGATSETNAAQSATDALQSKVESDANVTTVEAARDAAQTAQVGAAGKAVDAENAANASATSATNSQNSATASATSATASAASANDAEIFVKLTYYTGIINLTVTDSPYDILLSDEGKLFRVDTSFGDVVLNLPTRPSVSPDFRFSVLKIDASANDITIVPYGADTVGGSAQEVMSMQFYGITFTPGIFSDWEEKIFTFGTSTSGIPTLVTETPAGIVNNVNTLFTLSQPSLSDSLIFWVNGIKLLSNEYSVVGRNVSLVSPPDLGQSIEVWYFVTDVSTSGMKGKDETLVGVIDEVNKDFTITDNAFNKPSTIIFNRGLKVPAAEWTLTQTVSGSIISFLTAPELGSQIEAFYLINQLQAASSPPPVPGSGGALIVYGDRLAPMVINSTGVVPADERRQLWYTKSDGGAVTMPGTQIAPGFRVGDELIIVGCDATDFLDFVDGRGCEFNGAFSLKAGAGFTAKKYLIYDGVVWSETPML